MAYTKKRKPVDDLVIYLIRTERTVVLSVTLYLFVLCRVSQVTGRLCRGGGS